MKHNFKKSLMLAAGSLILLVLLGQLIFTVFLSKVYFLNYKEKQVEELYTRILMGYEDDAYSLYRIVERSVEDNNLSVLVFNDSELIFSNLNTNIPGLTLSYLEQGPEEWRKFSTSPQALYAQTQKGEAGNIILTGKFMYRNAYRYVVIESPVESIDASIAVLTRVNLMISGTVLIVAMVLAYFVAKRVAKPIESVKNVAEAVADLDFTVRADECQPVLELGSLSRSINKMSDSMRGLITDLTAANAKLQADIEHQRQLDKMHREFISNVSHELKTPLFLLMMYSENLRDNADNIDRDYYLETIIDEAKHMDAMVKSLLDISSVENGLSKMNYESLDLSAFAKHIMDKTGVIFEGYDLAWFVEDGLHVEGDPVYLENAMNNFLTNAKSHTPEGGAIRVSLVRDGRTANFSVMNEGKAIADEDMDKIWESFYMTDKSRVRTDENHSGLGLYIVKTIVQAHRGRYGVDNVAGGVRFWFSLPLWGEMERRHALPPPTAARVKRIIDKDE